MNLLAADQLDALLVAAIAAPSMHHTQPWRFELNGHTIDMVLDGWPAEEPSRRAMRIAAGAAAFNLRCAAASLGYHTVLGLAPCPDEPDLVARIVLAPADAVDQELRALAVQIPHRHTSHVPLRNLSLSQDVRIALTAAVCKENAVLTWLPEAEIARIPDLVLEKDLREIGAWYRTSAAFERLPAIAVLWTERDEAANQLTAGLALERLLLTATREGVTASILNQALEYDALHRSTGTVHLAIRFC